MQADKALFYRLAAERFAASTYIYRVDAVVHLEAKDDEWFWEKVLNEFYPRRYKFIFASYNDKGSLTSSCEQCLKYKGYLSKKFFICIDSDFRYLQGESMEAREGILQTYTYSWENHCAYKENLQKRYALLCGKDFDFVHFLNQYSKLVYRPLLFVLLQESKGLSDFNRNDLKKCISLQYEKGDELNNGVNIIKKLGVRFEEQVGALLKENAEEIDCCAYRCAALGLNEDNAYLYIRGHNLFNLLISLGRKLCEKKKVDFMKEILMSSISFGEYDEIKKINRDVAVLMS